MDSIGIWSMATRVIFSGRTTSLPAWSVIVRVDEAVVSWVVCSDWAAVEPEPPVHLALEAVGVGVAGQVGRETLRPAVQQGGLGFCPQPIATEPVTVVGP